MVIRPKYGSLPAITTGYEPVNDFRGHTSNLGDLSDAALAILAGRFRHSQ